MPPVTRHPERSIMNRLSTLLCIAVAGACASATSAQVVYSHYVIPPTIGGAVVSPNWEVGELVTLSGGAQQLGAAQFKFGTINSAPNGEGTLHLNFYANSGAAPGALFATFAQPVSVVGTGPIEVVFDTGSLSVPASVWVAVWFVQTSGGIPGVRMNTQAPTVGTVSVTRAFREGGVGPWGTDPVGDWMTMQLIAAAPPCYANCDGSTIAPILNVSDFICFGNRFVAGDTWANCDGSTTAPILNVSDYICFNNLFAAGCR
jgi:hypothetical protein